MVRGRLDTDISESPTIYYGSIWGLEVREVANILHIQHVTKHIAVRKDANLISKPTSRFQGIESKPVAA